MESLPWRVLECDPGDWPDDDRCGGIRDADGERVVTTDSGVYGPDLETARFIVRAVNNHDALLAALKRLIDQPDAVDAYTDAEAAIAKAEGR